MPLRLLKEGMDYEFGTLGVDALRNIADHVVESAADWDALPTDVAQNDVVWVGPVQFETSTQWNMPPNTTLIGSGTNATHITLAGGSNSRLVDANSGCTIRDLTLDGNYLNQTSGGCTALQTGSTDVTYVNVHAIDGWRTCFGVRDCEDVKYIGCLAQAAGDDNFALGPGATNVTITGCISRNSRGAVSNSSSGYELDDGAQRVVLAGNISHNCYGAGVEIHDHSGTNGSRHVSVSGHMSVNDGRNAVHVNSEADSASPGYGFVISDVYAFEPGGAGIDVTGDPGQLKISNCLIDNPAGANGVHVRGAGPSNVSLSNITVNAGAATGSTASLFQIDAGTNVTLSGCEAYGSGANGIEIGSAVSDAVVRGCTTRGSGSRGVWIQSDGTRVQGHTSTNENLGIILGAVRSVAADCRIEGAADRGITATGNNTTIRDCDIHAATNDAVRLIDSVGATISGCTLRNSSNGLRVTGTGDRATVSGNRFDGNSFAIVLASGAHRVFDNVPTQSLDVRTLYAEDGNRGYHDGSGTSNTVGPAVYRSVDTSWISLVDGTTIS